MKRFVSMVLIGCLLTPMLFLSSCSIIPGGVLSSNRDDVSSNDEDYMSIEGSFTNIKVTDSESALKAVSEVAGSIGITDVEKELKVLRVDTFEQESYYRMQQYYNDIPVYGKDVVLATDGEGTPFIVTSNTVCVNEPLDTGVLVTDVMVEKSVKEYFAKELGAGEREIDLPKIEDCQLYVYQTDEGSFVTALLMNTGFYELLINAQTGAVLKCVATVYESGSVTCFNGDGSESFEGYFDDSEQKYTAYNEERNIYVYNMKCLDSQKDFEKAEYLVSDDIFFGNSRYEDSQDYDKGVRLINNVSSIYDYFKKEFGETTYGSLYAYYNDGYDSGTNAWAGSFVDDNGRRSGCLSTGYVNGVEIIDVLAHEFTHIVSSYHLGWTRKPAGQTEAISEGYSDIFGEIIESRITGDEPDWIFDVVGINRNIVRPKSKGYPEKVNDKNRSKEKYGHAYSTVISHAAYLMWNGISGDESKKIDIDTLAKIWYRALFIMHSDVNFEQCADAVYKSAKTLNIPLSSEQLQCVKEAFNNAGISIKENLEYTVETGAKLFVLDSDFKNYGNYHLSIIPVQHSIYSNKPVMFVDTDITDASGVVLDLDEGDYQITVSDIYEHGSNEEYSCRVHLKKGTGKTKGTVKLYTNFGKKQLEDVFLGDKEESLSHFLNYFYVALDEYDSSEAHPKYDWHGKSLSVVKAFMDSLNCVDYSLYPVVQPDSLSGQEAMNKAKRVGLDDVFTEHMGDLVEYDKEAVYWVAQNIYNLRKEEIDSAVSDLLKIAEPYIRIFERKGDDGRAKYYTFEGGVGYVGYDIKYDWVKRDGDKYYIKYDLYSVFEEGTFWGGPYYAVMRYKNIDGSYYWSIYNNSSSVPAEMVALGLS